ncbi:T9SS type A sorting domain-containing protein [Paenimyroides viscosum]|uniref:T9SS C-terminal target domain-containing protein n=1 Tax=Paenimyroides viscosum TaxID=2488729 RepID=A0A3P1AJI0_9FLAO|nr:T9SS type A sorting domain-containing protein [Paenimyroides viscosum]RRA89299.1 T9SS C-terminal target domain-containing protein [Paenimyroides viscosum]
MKKKYTTLIIIFSFLGLHAQTNPYYQGDKCVTDISVDFRTASIFTIDGKVYTLGLNNLGQVGNGNTQPISVPYTRPSIPDFATISHGSLSSAGFTKDGKIYTWGNNIYGVLGNGTTINNFIPTQVGTDIDWVQVVNTSQNNIALKNNGTLWGWGNADNCALTNVPAAPFPNNFYMQPIQISPDTDWVSIGAAVARTFAIKSNGTLWAMGGNNYYSLGVSNSFHSQCISVLTQVGTDTNWKKIIPSNMGYYTLALKTDNTLWYWGSYNHNIYTPVQTPVQIETDTWKEVAAGQASAVGIKNDGTLWQWGSGCWSNDGSVIIPNQSLVPIQVGTASNWIKVAAGHCISFAVRADNTVWAFGANNMDFFNGSPSSPASPVLIFQCTEASTTEHELSNIVLYPNPTVDKIFWAQNIAIEKVTVFDMNGKQILSQKVSDFSLDVSHLSSGTYLIKLESDQGFYNSKFIKK